MRGYAPNAAGDSVYVTLGDETVGVTGFAPGTWSWANRSLPGGAAAQLAVRTPGLYTITLQMREDGLRLDRLLLTTDTTYVPLDTGPTETVRQTASAGLLTVVDRTIDYDYDNLYRLTGANYTTGQSYAYDYDPVGNRLQQIINGDTTAYLYDAANRLAQLNGQAVYTFDNNGNLLNSDTLTNTWDAANRLIAAEREDTTMQPLYNGVGDRVGQTIGVTTTHFALDVQGLPEVIYTSDGESYLHLPGVIMTESSTGDVRYLLSDGLGSVRQAVDETAQVVAYYEFDPYGNPVNNNGGDPYGYTGEWYGGYIDLLHLRTRWYNAETGTFLSRDTWEGSRNGYGYVSGNPVNLIDPFGWYGCNSTTGRCDDGRYLCVIQGKWSGSYVDGKPCIVNPSNVQTGNGPTPVRQRRGTTLDDMPAYWWNISPVARPPQHMRPITPVSPPNACNCSDSTMLPYKRYQYSTFVQYVAGQYLFVDEVIIFEDNLPQVDTSLKNDTFARGFSVASIILDAVEIGSAANSIVIPDAAAAGDAVVASLGSMTSGETYYASPHECLPKMLVIGQDILVNGGDFLVGTGGKYILAGTGAATGAPAGGGGAIPGAIGGYITGAGIDVTTSTAALAHDFAKGTGIIGPHISYGFYIDRKVKTVLLLGGFE